MDLIKPKTNFFPKIKGRNNPLSNMISQTSVLSRDKDIFILFFRNLKSRESLSTLYIEVGIYFLL